MYNKLIALAALFLVAMATYADEVSYAKAKLVAQKFMMEKGITGQASYQARRRVPGGNAQIDAQKVEPYYVFNASATDGGFVIVAGNDAYGEVLGYSNEGHIDLDNAPEGLKALLTAYEHLMEKAAITASLTEGRGTPLTPSLQGRSGGVSPLLGNIIWGQDKPFNNLCPSITSSSSAKNYYVGCVATAMSQIMKHYGYPAKGNGTKTYASNVGELTADYGNTTYDWSNMLDDYTNVAYTDEQAAAAAQLCRDVAISVEMVWEAAGSGAFSQYVEGALENYFGYDKSASYIIRDYYPTTEWMRLLKAELDAHRPVFYSASNEDGQGGHAFVADGYDSADYIHINWGWFGKSNGYFLVNALEPYELGIGANGGGYNLHQEMVIGIQPDSQVGGSIPAIYAPTRMTGGSFGSIYLMCYLENNSVLPFSGKVAAVLVKDGAIVKVLKSDPLTMEPVKTVNAKLITDTKTIKVDNIPTWTSDVPDGDYQLRYAVQEDGSDTWHIVNHATGLPPYLEAKLMGGNIIVNTHEMKPEAELLAKIDTHGDVFSNGVGTFTVSLRNNSSEMNLGKVRLALTPVGSTDVACVLKDKSDVFNIYTNSTKTITMLVTIPELEPGDYEVTAYEEKYDNYPFSDEAVGKTVISVLPAPTTPVIRATSDFVWSNTNGTSEIKQNDVLAGMMTVRNYGIDGKVGILMKLRDADGREHPFMMQNLTMTKGQQSTSVLQRRLDLDPGTYQFVPYYITEDGREHPMETTTDNPGAMQFSCKENPSLSLYCSSLNLPTKMLKTEKYNGSITIKALRKVTSKTIYIRLRQFTNTSGEIVYMRSGVTLNEGDSVTYNFTYKPAIDYASYIPLVESKLSSTEYETMGGFKNYGKVYRVVQSLTGNGDANNDGTISVADLSLMASHILGEQTNINLDNADVNGDNQITVADLSALATIILNSNNPL